MAYKTKKKEDKIKKLMVRKTLIRKRGDKIRIMSKGEPKKE